MKGLTVGICGDLRYGRAAHFLCARRRAIRGVIWFISRRRGFQMPDWVLGENQASLRASAEGDLPAFAHVIGELDVIYVNRLQEERLPADIDPENGGVPATLSTPDVMRDAKSDAMIMHPLPRVNELSYELDEDPRARLFRAVRKRDSDAHGADSQLDGA